MTEERQAAHELEMARQGAMDAHLRLGRMVRSLPRTTPAYAAIEEEVIGLRGDALALEGRIRDLRDHYDLRKKTDP